MRRKVLAANWAHVGDALVEDEVALGVAEMTGVPLAAERWLAAAPAEAAALLTSLATCPDVEQAASSNAAPDAAPTLASTRDLLRNPLI